MGLAIALDIKPAFGLMNEVGVKQALGLVEEYARTHVGFPVPECLKKQAKSKKPFPVMHVVRQDSGDVAVVRIRRPKVLNALSGEVYTQLEQVFAAIKKDKKIKAAVLTGFGNKAFVSGADINFLAKIDSAEMAVATTEESKKTGTLIENLGKPVVCALNGFALGGGLELAMCCSAILCAKDLPMAAGLPEVNLGIIPGSGGTQRLPRWVGLEKAAGMLRTGKPIPGKLGLELGLFQQEVEWGKLLDTAIALARDLAAGSAKGKGIDPKGMQVPERLPDVELGHLSKAIDKILCRAILEGCRKPLKEGLRVESEMFGECYKTQDMKIGLDNFIKNGPKAKAPFQHA
jgi:enoyl-CoA hydratase/carnithine racemase